MSDDRAGSSSRLQRLKRYRDARRRASPFENVDLFEEIVANAVATLPRYISERMDNVAVVVEERPDPAHMARLGYDPHRDLLGLYEGVPRDHRSSGYHLAVPDRITIYRGPILAQVGGGDRLAVAREVRKTVIHEVAHHFGITDAEIEQLEREAR